MSVILTILYTVLLFGFLIFIHELGHYVAARSFGVGVREFAIGMGPKLKSWKGKVNDFSIRAFPIGGFVSMVGETSADKPEEGDEGKVGLNTKPLWQRAIVVLAGPFMNLLTGFILMTVFVSCLHSLPTTTVGKFGSGSISNATGLQVGDEIVEIDGTSIRVYNDIAYVVALRGKDPLEVKVIRDGSEVTLSGVIFPVDSSSGASMGDIDFLPVYTGKTFGNVMYNAFWQSYSSVRMTYESLYRTIRGEYGMDAVSGPIGIGGEVEHIADLIGGEILQREKRTAFEINRHGIVLLQDSSPPMGEIDSCSVHSIPIFEKRAGHFQLFFLYLTANLRGAPFAAPLPCELSGTCQMGRLCGILYTETTHKATPRRPARAE